jgi:hypothetical protein
MTTLKDWDNEAADLSVEALDQFIKALEVLEDWDFFNEAFKWTGIFSITKILKSEKKVKIERDKEEILADVFNDMPETVKIFKEMAKHIEEQKAVTERCFDKLNVFLKKL